MHTSSKTALNRIDFAGGGEHRVRHGVHPTELQSNELQRSPAGLAGGSMPGVDFGCELLLPTDVAHQHRNDREQSADDAGNSSGVCTQVFP